ncbi:MAG: hypothetical protein Q9M37_02045 [Desulfonauticus sp.]|nr:hypothetical protein [Desulfonauticus sp.]
MKKKILFILLAYLLFAFQVRAAPTGFTQADRERLIKLETTLQVFMEQTDKRLEDLRKDMNSRFEQVDKRFEQVDKRFEQMMNFLWILTTIFTTLTLGVIGFAYWDRRTIISKAKEEAIREIEREGKLRNLILALRELAKSDRQVANVLKSFGLL